MFIFWEGLPEISKLNYSSPINLSKTFYHWLAVQLMARAEGTTCMKVNIVLIKYLEGHYNDILFEIQTFSSNETYLHI